MVTSGSPWLRVTGSDRRFAQAPTWDRLGTGALRTNNRYRDQGGDNRCAARSSRPLWRRSSAARSRARRRRRSRSPAAPSAWSCSSARTGADGLGQDDRQPGQGDLDPEFLDRASCPLSADAGGQLRRHRRLPDRRDLARHPRQPLHRPVAAYRSGADRPELQDDHREQHGRRRPGRDALVHRRRACSTTARTCSRSTARSRRPPGRS